MHVCMYGVYVLTHARQAAGIDGGLLAVAAAEECEEGWSGGGREFVVAGLKRSPGPHESPTWESSGEPVLDVDRGAGDVPYKSIIK